jgi:hypothetical protein
MDPGQESKPSHQTSNHPRRLFEVFNEADHLAGGEAFHCPAGGVIMVLARQ